MLPSAHKNTLRVPGYCAGQVRGGEGTSYNRLWSPEAYGLTEQQRLCHIFVAKIKEKGRKQR